MSRYYMNVPFAEKDEAKGLGAKWDYEEKKWYFTDQNDAYLFTKWLPSNALSLGDLSEEQQSMVALALEGRNILVDACIGSGKTTTIQVLCNEMNDKKILYLTYNRLLKEDARDKINGRNIIVTNYHGFAYQLLKDADITCGQGELIQTYIANLGKVAIPTIDLLVLDEYQDIDTEISEMLLTIKSKNPRMQIVAVGDMAQKIYDKTTLDVTSFISSFLGSHERVFFTKCFRISNDLASTLGYVWEKEINGVNDECEVCEMTLNQAFRFLATQEPGDILCLGPRTGQMSVVLNALEEYFPEKFNKNTVYASIRDEDRNINVSKNNAIFTTYDSSKGMERKICVVFDFTNANWHVRTHQANANPEILRNVFCVAASRGKEKIVFVNEPGFEMVDIERLRRAEVSSNNNQGFQVSDMFSFKYIEQVEKCFSMLHIEKIPMEDESVIDIKSNDGLIDISPCIGHYQEACYFNKYDVDSEMNFMFRNFNKNNLPMPNRRTSTREKVLYITALDTGQNRYFTQVDQAFVSEEEERRIKDRLSSVLSENATVQVDNSMDFGAIHISGRADVVSHMVVYELKFVTELSHEHFLQCACYMVSLGLEKGVLWNVKNNEMYSITIPDRESFLKQVLNTITKGKYKEIRKVSKEYKKDIKRKSLDTLHKELAKKEKSKKKKKSKKT